MDKLNENLPFVSIIVPVYNEEKRIGDCIESLLGQDYPKEKFEIIIVDNGSADNTAEIINKYSVKYVLEIGNQSAYAARNAGIRISKGEILAFTDLDCIAGKAWLITLISGFNQGVGGVAGEILEAEPKSIVEKFQIGICQQKVQLVESKHPFAATANIAYRREVLATVGLFRDDLVSGGDADLSWRVINAGFQIEFKASATVVHAHRKNILGIYKQSKRYAFGGVCLSVKYPHMRDKRKGFLRKQYIKLVYELLLVVYRIFTFIFKQDKVYYLAEPFLMMVDTFGYIKGELLGRRYIRGMSVICPHE